MLCHLRESLLPDGLTDHLTLIHPISTSKVLGKESEVLLYSDVLAISVGGSGWSGCKEGVGAVFREANNSSTLTN